MTQYTQISSPLGPLLLERSPKGLTRIALVDADHAPTRTPDAERADAAFSQAIDQLEGYFAGTRTAFDLALDPSGTPFQRQVWDALCTIPYGTTWSYGQLAKAIGRPSAARAVGAANGRNPLPIVVPCHRVIGSTGTLTGYRGGVRFKRALLELESPTPGLFPS